MIPNDSPRKTPRGLVDEPSPLGIFPSGIPALAPVDGQITKPPAVFPGAVTHRGERAALDTRLLAAQVRAGDIADAVLTRLRNDLTGTIDRSGQHEASPTFSLLGLVLRRAELSARIERVHSRGAVGRFTQRTKGVTIGADA
jgi:hypothetical protein